MIYFHFNLDHYKEKKIADRIPNRALHRLQSFAKFQVKNIIFFWYAEKKIRSRLNHVTFVFAVETVFDCHVMPLTY